MPEQPKQERLYIYPKTELVIDNGEDFISIDRGLVAEELSRCGLSEESIMKLLSAVNDYAEQVKSELQKGVHLGSTDLVPGVNSIFYAEQYLNNPAAFGLQTETELKLAANLIANACVKRKKFELGEVEEEIS